jgi:hypothetical protein
MAIVESVLERTHVSRELAILEERRAESCKRRSMF